MTGDTNLPTRTPADRWSSALKELDQIPEQEIWLSKRKSACNCRPYPAWRNSEAVLMPSVRMKCYTTSRTSRR